MSALVRRLKSVARSRNTHHPLRCIVVAVDSVDVDVVVVVVASTWICHGRCSRSLLQMPRFRVLVLRVKELGLQ